MRSVKERAFAKINLYLEVIGKRDDGFHDLRTVMHSVTLCDDITVSLVPTRITEVRIDIEGNPRLPKDSRNLAVKAAELFLERSGRQGTVHIRMNKRIPVAAGLAGGSSDAAAVLRAMNRLFDGCYTERALSGLAAELGSDVPFCLIGGTALCEGRGEIITKLPDASPSSFVIAVSDERVSTPYAYAALDAAYSDFEGSIPLEGQNKLTGLLSELKKGRISPVGFYNSFEAVILPTCPAAARIKEEMLRLGADGAMMSGSGPSVVGLFNNREAAEAAATEMRLLGVVAFVVASSR